MKYELEFLVSVHNFLETDMEYFKDFHWRRKWQPTPVYLPGKSHGQRSLAGYSP